jgi:hypothetical protein
MIKTKGGRAAAQAPNSVSDFIIPSFNRERKVSVRTIARTPKLNRPPRRRGNHSHLRAVGFPIAWESRPSVLRPQSTLFPEFPFSSREQAGEQRPSTALAGRPSETPVLGNSGHRGNRRARPWNA